MNERSQWSQRRMEAAKQIEEILGNLAAEDFAWQTNTRGLAKYAAYKEALSNNEEFINQLADMTPIALLDAFFKYGK